MDAAIAGKVMGEIVTWGTDGGGAKIPWCGEPEGVVFECPSWSTDMSDAWLVVEKLAENNLVVSVAWGNGRDGCKYASVNIMLDMFTDATSVGHAECGAKALTAPHAICLAALKAVA